MSLPLFADEETAAEREAQAVGEESLVAIETRLLARDGPPRERPYWNPLKELVYVLISARTRTEVSLAVVAQLEMRYGAALGDWRGLRDAPLEDVLSILAPVTFPEKKAPTLQAALRRITRQNGGSLSLDFFAGQSVERIRSWLESFHGVGVKGSAAVVNHSSLRLRGLAVDSHLHRIAKRLELVSESATTDRTEQAFLRLMPEDRWPPKRLTLMHDLLKLHGQIRCTSRDWQHSCSDCPLLSICPTGTAIVDAVDRMRPAVDAGRD